MALVIIDGAAIDPAKVVATLDHQDGSTAVLMEGGHSIRLDRPSTEIQKRLGIRTYAADGTVGP